MADLFTLPELAAYMQAPSVNGDSAELLLELVTDLIADTYGGDLPDPPPAKFRRIALEAAKRAYLNPNGYRSETLPDGYSYTRGNDTSRAQAGLYLTDVERRQITSAAGGATVRTTRLVTSSQMWDEA
jgi:hypothetical protein